MKSGPLEHSFIGSPSEISVLNEHELCGSTPRFLFCRHIFDSSQKVQQTTRSIILPLEVGRHGGTIPYHTTARESCVVLRV